MADYSEDIVQSVWERGRARQDRNPDEWRQDQCGAWMNRRHYNNRNSEYGWKILGTAPGKSESTEHLYPFQWRNDFDIANGRPHCQVTADRTDISPGQHVDTPRNTDA